MQLIQTPFEFLIRLQPAFRMMKQSCLPLLLIFFYSQTTHVLTNVLDLAELSYNLKTTVDAYEKAGKKNPKWDANASKCLLIVSQIRALTNGSPAALFNDLKSTLPLVMTAGCDDPLIRYFNLRYVDRRTKTEAASDYNAIGAALRASDYPDIRKFYGTYWAHRFMPTSSAKESESAAALDTAAAYLAKALDDPAMPFKEVDQACDLLMSDAWWADAQRWKCYQALQPALETHWKNSSIALLAKGRGYVSRAWEARGTGYADTVSSNGWILFSQRLDVAATTLQRRWTTRNVVPTRDETGSHQPRSLL